MAKVKRARRLCPECRDSCSCGGRKLYDLGGYATEWYGFLRWFKCRCCKTTFVSQGGSRLMVAAIQR